MAMTRPRSSVLRPKPGIAGPPHTGFTLIELKIGIGVLVSQLRNRVHKATALTLLNALLTAFSSYRDEDPRQRYPMPRADGLLSRNPADLTAVGTVLGNAFQPRAAKFDRQSGDSTSLCLVDGRGRGVCDQLVAPSVDAGGHLQSAMMQQPAVVPATLTDWNPTNLRPLAYHRSLGKSVQGLPNDAASVNAGQWLNRHVGSP